MRISVLLSISLIISGCEGNLNYFEMESHSNGNFATVKEAHQRDDADYVLIKYYDNGGLRSISEFKNNELDGLNGEYYPNGQLKLLQEFEEGKLHGKAKGWYDNGAFMFDETNYKGLKMSFKRYYDNGILGSSIEYDYGRKTFGTFYYPNGNTRMKGGFRYDNRINNWVFYDSAGIARDTINYGDPVGDRIKNAQDEQ